MAEGVALNSRWGLRTLVPVSPSFEKNYLPANFFLLQVLLQSIINLHWHFYLSNINTHFDFFFKLRHVWVSYISWHVLGNTSLTSLPIFAQQRVKKTQWYTEKMRTFKWIHIPALFYDSVVCFLLPRCVFFYQWCLSWIPLKHYVSR